MGKNLDLEPFHAFVPFIKIAGFAVPVTRIHLNGLDRVVYLSVFKKKNYFIIVYFSQCVCVLNMENISKLMV